MDEIHRVGRVRVYEIAKEAGLPNNDLVTKIQALGIDIKNHMSSLDLEEVQRVKRALEKERQENLVEERLSATVIRRRSKHPQRHRRMISAPNSPTPFKDSAVKERVVMDETGSGEETIKRVRSQPLSPPPAEESTFHQEVAQVSAQHPEERAEMGGLEDAQTKQEPEEKTVEMEKVSLAQQASPIPLPPDMVGAQDGLRRAKAVPPDSTEHRGDDESRLNDQPPLEKSVVIEESQVQQKAEPVERGTAPANKSVAMAQSSSAQATEEQSRVAKAQVSRAEEEKSVEARAKDVKNQAYSKSKAPVKGEATKEQRPPREPGAKASPPRRRPDERGRERSREHGVREQAVGGEKKEEVKPPPVVHRYAPGFKPGMQYGPKARRERQQQEQRAKSQQQAAANGEQAISAADAIKMMVPLKPKVVITNLDGRGPGARREVVTRKELFPDKQYKAGGKKKRKATNNKRSRKTEITTPAQHKRVIRLQEAITVGEIARQMGIKSTEVLKHLWDMGLTNITLNHSIDPDTASLLAGEFSYEVEDVSFNEKEVLHQTEDQPEDLESRPAVVTVMGHVDHGKTSLLDAIRNTSVVDGEAGGITQHIGASRIKSQSGALVFLDTPGHEAFTAMRARGAQCTDMVVLVVAADDSVMPQTIEAIDHARDAKVPIIVAVNKIDRPNANPDRVRNELAERGLISEEWGGDTLFVNVSAKTRQGIDDLLENLFLQSELLELKANPKKLAKGTIVEAKLDKARGAMCAVLVQEGTLRVGDIVVTGAHMGKVRALLDEHGRNLKEAGPSVPVEVLGLGGVPQAGDILNSVADERSARSIVEHRKDEYRKRDLAGTASLSSEEILKQIRSGETKELKLLIKADVHGSSEAVRESLLKLSTEKVTVNVISAGVGGINENDVNLAKAANAIIAGFNVRAAGKAAQLAEREGVDIRIYDVIYELLDEVKVLMRGLLPKERRERLLGRAEVRQTFVIPKIGVIAGCGVQDGKITRNSQLRLVRNNIKVYDGRVGSLRRFKDDVKEVQQGYECGISIEGYKDIQVGDVIEAYEMVEVAPVL